MLKSELITLVNALRAENSLLTTQLAAARCAPRETRSIDAVRRLVAKYPQRRSFTSDEVRAEAACSV